MMETSDQMLAHHLRYNHFPPQPAAMVPYCQIAIERAEAGDWDTEITIKGSAKTMTVTVAQLVEDLHLDNFIAAREEHPHE